MISSATKWLWYVVLLSSTLVNCWKVLFSLDDSHSFLILLKWRKWFVDLFFFLLLTIRITFVCIGKSIEPDGYGSVCRTVSHSSFNAYFFSLSALLQSIDRAQWWTYLDRWEDDRSIGSVTRYSSSSCRLFVVFAFLLTRTNLFPAGNVVFWENVPVLLLFVFHLGIYTRRQTDTEKDRANDEYRMKERRKNISTRKRKGKGKGDTGCIRMKAKRGLSWLCTSFLLSSFFSLLSPFSFASWLLVREASSHSRPSSLQRRRQRQRFVPISSQDY